MTIYLKYFFKGTRHPQYVKCGYVAEHNKINDGRTHGKQKFSVIDKYNYSLVNLINLFVPQ